MDCTQGVQMGLFDTYISANRKVQIQLKIHRDMRQYREGDDCPLSDGVYLGFEGAVVAKDGKVVLVTETVRDKWDNPLDSEDIISPKNPIKAVLQELKPDE